MQKVGFFNFTSEFNLIIATIHFGLMCVPVVAGTCLRFNYPRDASSL